jgi:hypothetical protein
MLVLIEGCYDQELWYRADFSGGVLVPLQLREAVQVVVAERQRGGIDSG